MERGRNNKMRREEARRDGVQQGQEPVSLKVVNTILNSIYSPAVILKMKLGVRNVTDDHFER